MPHGMCYLWRPDVLWLHVTSDVLIAVAYASISVTLLYFVRKRTDLEFHWIFVCFAVFIIACGMTHAMEIWVIWQPYYWLSGWIKAATAVASGTTAILTIRLLPDALALPSPAVLRLAYAELRSEGAQRHQVEQNLIAANQRLSKQAARGRLAAIVESSDDAILSIDKEGLLTSWNSGAERMLGYSPDETIGKLSPLSFPADRSGDEADRPEHPVLAEAIGTFETRGVRKDGQSIEISLTSSPICDDAGSVVGTSIIARDITERKRAEKKAAGQLARLQLLHTLTRAIGERQDLQSIIQIVVGNLEDQLPVDFGCLCLYEPPGDPVVAGVGAVSLGRGASLGLTDRAVVPIDQNWLAGCRDGQTVYEPDLAVAPSAFSQRLFASGLRSMVCVPLLVDGMLFAILILARQQPGSFGGGEREFLRQLADHVALAARQTRLYANLQAAYEDLRRTQQTVVRQEKLRVLGQMASGIAHDINNTLTPASLYVEDLLERAPAHSETQSSLLIVQRAIDGVAQTIARMKEFYAQRDTQLAHVPISLNRLVTEVVDLTRARWSEPSRESGGTIRVDIQLAEDLPEIVGNVGEVRDALINLIMNAADAMPQGGVLTLRSRFHAAEPAPNVQFEVIDTGIGMDEATRSRCFELFFSTKGTQGTGLGLAMVYGTMQRHGGEMQIESALERGTIVRLRFPAARPAARTGDDIRPIADAQRSLNILLVDDDPMVLGAVRTAIERDRHVVKTADGGRAGIEACRAEKDHGRSFDLVITDLGMPAVDGRLVAAAVKALDPGTVVILLTGWGNRLIAENDLPANVDLVLEKPTKLTALRAAINELAIVKKA